MTYLRVVLQMIESRAKWEQHAQAQQTTEEELMRGWEGKKTYVWYLISDSWL
eukprot:CAMPEP_0184296360 /NCGR_PEP_ID=MMETSP1049-20130417/7351_1 /TAXON_ID=77928 /ORGANISM="Proteomonas sulcata, Strain CCMP704" /LENGTH=51 /DNA_ID=CAMNT_0026605561 /DNA_START=85 /DNA_END=237 /DNA_ORIENTATION=-